MNASHMPMYFNDFQVLNSFGSYKVKVSKKYYNEQEDFHHFFFRFDAILPENMEEFTSIVQKFPYSRPELELSGVSASLALFFNKDEEWEYIPREGDYCILEMGYVGERLAPVALRKLDNRTGVSFGATGFIKELTNDEEKGMDTLLKDLGL